MAADSTGSSGSAGAAAAASFDGKLTGWPENESLNISIDKSLNVCNVPIDQKAFVRYFACEWMKNQSSGNARSQALQAIQSAQTLYSELSSRGYMD